jgi:glyoxylase-like metal-dependent hydrolase (beta-lactamase superfamily II)
MVLSVVLMYAFTAFAKDVFKIEKISNNVYAFITPNATHDMVDGNSTAILTKDGIIVIDTYGNPDIARRMILELKKITPLPVKYVVNTHWHYDHITGNSVFKKYYPHCIIIAQAATRTLMDTLVPAAMKTEPQASMDIIAEYKAKIKSGKKDDSTLLTAYERNIRYPETIRDAEYFIASFGQYSYAPPEITFTDTLFLFSGEDKIILFYPGKAHTIGDAVVYLPAQNILITGDLLVSPVPYALGAYHDTWMEALKRIVQLHPAILIPGHGDVQRDLSYVQLVIELLDTLETEVHAAVTRNLTLEQAWQEIQLNEFRLKLTGTYEDRGWAFENYFRKPGIKSVYNRLKGIARLRPN